MWPRLSRFLEGLARLSPPRRPRLSFIMGTTPVDGLGGEGWREFVRAEPLYDVWGPVAGSHWAPYHCVTLFAAIDIAEADGVAFPAAPPELAPWLAAPEPPAWAGPGTWLIVDLPGVDSVALGLHLVATAGYQPVCTFDNWPHIRGLLRSEAVLAALLHGASAMAQHRARLGESAPPMWLCDRDRLSDRARVPGRFDNRYILEDRLMPPVSLLRVAGIERVVCVVASVEAGPGLDLMVNLQEYAKAGLEVAQVGVSDAFEWAAPRPLPPKPADDKALRTLVRTMVRASGGGFGGFIPTPSSG